MKERRNSSISAQSMYARWRPLAKVFFLLIKNKGIYYPSSRMDCPRYTWRLKVTILTPPNSCWRKVHRRTMCQWYAEPSYTTVVLLLILLLLLLLIPPNLPPDLNKSQVSPRGSQVSIPLYFYANGRLNHPSHHLRSPTPDSIFSFTLFTSPLLTSPFFLNFLHF